MRQPIAIARTAPEIKPKYEKDPVIEKLEIRNTAVLKTPLEELQRKQLKTHPMKKASLHLGFSLQELPCH